MTYGDVPEGLGPLQYAAKLCEDLGIPQRGNIQMIGESIEAVSKSRLFRGQEKAMRNAFIWLHRRVFVARDQGQKINTLWFHGGEFWNVTKPESAIPQQVHYQHFGQGYGTNDVMWLYERYMSMKDSLPNRPMTDGEIDRLLDELDSKRGGGPEWRRQCTSKFNNEVSRS